MILIQAGSIHLLKQSSFGQNDTSAADARVSVPKIIEKFPERLYPKQGRSGQVRIIGGNWRSRRIGFPDRPGLRPTPDRVRETLFNWLGQDLSGYRCLDLYAGSGVLGLEALSRGASHVTLIDRDAVVAQALKNSAEALNASGFRIICSDALKFLHQAATRERYDLIFLDPPFSDGTPDQVLAALPDVLAPGGRIFLEGAGRRGMQPPWFVEKDGRAGKVFFQLLRRESK